MKFSGVCKINYNDMLVSRSNFHQVTLHLFAVFCSLIFIQIDRYLFSGICKGCIIYRYFNRIKIPGSVLS